MTVPFVGREAELQAIGALIARARREHSPGSALITGEPGSGKSRLLRESVAHLDPRRTVSVAGFEPTERIPLAATGDLVRRLASVPDHGRRLDALVFGSSQPRGQGLLATFEAAHRAQTAFGPIVVSIDDLQWVDAQSLSLLHYLVRAAEATRSSVVVVAAARPSPAAITFENGMAGPLPDSRRASIELRGLPLGDGISLAQAIDDRLDEGAAAELWRRAAGSPFWLEALARGGSTNAVDLVTDRLRALSADAAGLLDKLSIGGRPFAHDELAGLVDWPAKRLEHAARELVGRGLAIDLRGAIRLSHDLIREAAARTIPVTTQRTLHAALARRLETAAGDDLRLLAEALDHRSAAGLPTADLAARLLTSPQRRLIGADGLRRLASIADDLPTGSAEQIALDRGVGQLASVLGEQDLAIDRWLRLAANERDATRRQDAFWEAGRSAFRLARAAAAHAYLDNARSAAPLTPAAIARIEALHAEIALWVDHDTPAGALAADKAVAAARSMLATAGGLDRSSMDERQTYLGALEAAIGAAMQEERFADVSSLTKEILLVARGLDDESFVAALIRNGFALRPLGAVHEAEAMYRQAWDICQRAVLPVPMIEAGIGLARVLRDLGRLPEAHEVAVETVALEARLGYPPGRWGNALLTLHSVELSIGHPGGFAALREDARMDGNPHSRMAIHQLIGAWQARAGGRRYEREVESELGAARTDALLAGCPRCAGEVAVVSAELFARIARPVEAKLELAGWEARPVPEYPMRRLWRARAMASIATAEGDNRAATAALESLGEAFEEAGLLDDLVWVHLDVGAILARRDRAGAIEAYTAAAALAERIGAVGRARMAARALRELGVRAWRRGTGTRASDRLRDLSRREREVAALIAGGSSNREIAETLVLSPKTVERHVTNILAKLGARNRTELASLVHAASVRGSPDD